MIFEGDILEHLTSLPYFLILHINCVYDLVPKVYEHKRIYFAYRIKVADLME